MIATLRALESEHMNDSDPIDEFKEKWDQEWYYEPVDWPGPPFVNTPALRDWMHRPPDDGTQTNFERILSNITDRNPQRNVFFPRPSETDLTEEGTGYTLVLSSLIQLEGSPCHYLYDFRRCKINDDTLKNPQDLENRLKDLRPVLRDDERLNAVAIKRILESFSERARMFNPVIFDFNPSRLPIPRDSAEVYPETFVLPYCVRDEIGSQGATSKVFDILVPRELIAEQMRAHLPPPFVWSQSKEHTPTQVYSFVVKTYGTTPQNQRDYERECEAFRGLQNGVTEANDPRVSSMVRFFSCFEHTAVDKNGERETTYSILLESGWKNLMEIYENLPPPQHTLEIIRSWERVLNIAEALSTINEFRFLSDTGRDPQLTYHGCHGDIKPDNILIFGERDDEDTDSAKSVHGPRPYKLKLGDFGFAQFATNQGSAEPKMRMPGYTPTYGAPELFQSKEVTQAIDVWSFGCVLYIHATWIVKGPDDIQTFAKLRTAGASSDELEDAFHNGQKALEEVRAWHTHLKASLRGSDNITGSILDIASELLVASPKERLKPIEIRQRLKSIVAKARNEAPKVSPTIEGAAGENLIKALAESEKQRRLPKVRKSTFKGNLRELKSITTGGLEEHTSGLPKRNASNRCTSRLDDQRQERYQIPTATVSPGPLRIEVPVSSTDFPAEQERVCLEGGLQTEPENNLATSPIRAESVTGSKVSPMTDDADDASLNADSPLRFTRRYRKSIMDVLKEKREGSIEELQELLGKHPSVAFCKDKNHMTPIMFAARRDLVAKFGVLFKHYKDRSELEKLNDTDSEGQNVLHHLTREPTSGPLLREIRRIAEACPNIVNERDANRQKPMYWAFQARNSVALGALLKAGATLEETDFLQAVQQDDQRNIKYLCDYRRDQVADAWIQRAYNESQETGEPTTRDLLRRYLNPVQGSGESSRKLRYRLFGNRRDSRDS